MHSTDTIKGLERYRVMVFRKRNSLSVVEKIILSFIIAVLTGLFAQVRFYLPVTPIPFTGQVFAVLLSGILLGRIYGGLSQIFYVGFGMMGMPWFAGGAAGSLLSPTAGYLFGFILAALFIGWLADKTDRSRNFFHQVAVLIAATGIIYLCGTIYYISVFQTGIKTALFLTVYPFIIFDILKAIGVAVIAYSILPNTRL